MQWLWGGLCGWCVIVMFAMAFIRGADERRQGSQKRETRLEVQP